MRGSGDVSGSPANDKVEVATDHFARSVLYPVVPIWEDHDRRIRVSGSLKGLT